MEKSNDAIINTDVLATVSEWSKSGMKTAIATVIDTWGSSPRPAGSQLGVNERCEMIGSVSGGCIEGAVVKIKDPIEYLKRLEFHNNVKNYEDYFF